MQKRLLFLLFFMVIVSINVNSSPVFNENKTGEINLKEYDSFSYQLKANDSNNNLTFMDLANLTNFKSFKMNSSGYINFKVSYGDVGYYPVMLIVRDDNYDADIITWNFNISNSSNIAPSVIYAPDLEQNINESNSIKFNANATDVNNDILTSKWFLDDDEKAININDYIYNTNYASAGKHNVIFEVNDGNISTYVTWNITVKNIDLVPYLIKPIDNITINQGREYNFNLIDYFTDDDGDKLNYSVNNVDNVNISINNDTSEVLIDPNEDFYGERELIFNAIDSAGNSNSSNTINLTVNKVENLIPRGEDADNKDRKKKQPVTEQTPVQSNKITGEVVNLSKGNEIIKAILDKAGFNKFKPNISFIGIISSLIIVAILIGIWIKIRINRRRNFGF
jgi:hypothetical protein